MLSVRPEFVLVAMGLHTAPNALQLQRLVAGNRCRLMFPAEAMSYSLPGSGFRDVVSHADAVVIKARPTDDQGKSRAAHDDRARVEVNEVADAVLAILEGPPAAVSLPRHRCHG